MPTLPEAKSLKPCPKCKQYLELSQFSFNRSTYDGLATYCKTYAKTAQKNYLNKINKMDAEYRKKVADIQLRLLHLTTAKNALKRSNHLRNEIEDTITKVVKALSTEQIELMYENLLLLLDQEIRTQEAKYDNL